ncbi:MAG: hypothetical protein LBB78_02145 [Spirochaetaceae bacterium]|nr:hypothetical protein [Spirochaetaceae bacterium]
MVLVLMTVLASCDSISGFFSTSWGSGLERDKEGLLPKINAGNALELAKDSAGDKKKAKLVTEKIRDALAKTNDPAEQQELLKAGLLAANNSSDLIMAVMGNLNTLNNPQVTVGMILEKVQAAGDVQANAGLISGLLDAGKVENAADLAGVAQDDLVLAAVTLLLADAQSLGKMTPDTQEDYLKDFDQKKQNPYNLTDKQKKALVLAGAAAQSPGPLTDMLKNFHLL